MKQHFVTFYSPGTFVAESTTKPIDSWDVEQAKSMAQSITERYTATPYGFQFTTRERADNELDSRETNRSGIYYLGGVIVTLDEVRQRADPDERILLSNMESNHYDKVVFNYNSWKSVHPLEGNDVVLEWTPAPSKKAT